MCPPTHTRRISFAPTIPSQLNVVHEIAAHLPRANMVKVFDNALPH
ncbi:hypothetical protein SNOG_13112 [Parastagonospora nodorum SN15]|uniref:Uncharacterized protein n=1 Tax=Phaeosphaeria nodorum (strain SN15 / ATCC MYA-4574 / FGSC 10173) TaxID=321614 RepID=Q0U552_PHANO|nr:hypothetical protein SNOG_13112 [Parastagonospora nodorum SN15]EAT79439.1 hypothetical protein SNOG_13112 [Parastagonospora nodorum SN15]